MMKSMQKTLLAIAVMATTSLPALAESVDVRVKGTITPAACTPSLSGGGTIDYGAINPASLSDTAFTTLPEQHVTFSIVCDAPAKVAVKATSARLNSVAGATEGFGGAAMAPTGLSLFGAANFGVVGLGLAGSDKIGGYAMRITPGTAEADGTAVDVLFSDDAKASWTKAITGGILNNVRVRHISWGQTGTTVPVAFTTFNAELSVQAYLNKASELDLTKPVALDGLSTIELVYL